MTGVVDLSVRYGYIGVEPPLEQFYALSDIDISDENTCVDSKDFEESAYTKLIEDVCSGDVLYVGSIDNFRCNYVKIYERWKMLFDKKVDVIILDLPLVGER